MAAIGCRKEQYVKYRNEIKHIITPGDKVALCASLRAVAQPDTHADIDGTYRVRSLYFDNLYDKALREKEDGLCDREKFRIRYYGDNLDFIRLEKKVKRNGVGYKVAAPLTAQEVNRLLNDDVAWMAVSGRGLLIELYSKMQTQLLRPRVIVDYRRTAFVHGPGNVRVTIDDDIRVGTDCRSFLIPSGVSIPAGNGETILEVKWDEFLPGPIRHAVQLKGRRMTAFSKYSTCRMYG